MHCLNLVSIHAESASGRAAVHLVCYQSASIPMSQADAWPPATAVTTPNYSQIDQADPGEQQQQQSTCGSLLCRSL